jgi:hypothetical protein
MSGPSKVEMSGASLDAGGHRRWVGSKKALERLRVTGDIEAGRLSQALGAVQLDAAPVTTALRNAGSSRAGLTCPP